jgi:hypothetical protein
MKFPHFIFCLPNHSPLLRDHSMRIFYHSLQTT